MGDLGAVRAEDHFHDIQANGDVGIAQESQPGLRAARQGFLFLGIDGIGGPAQSAGGSALYLDEDQRFFLAADQVDLSAVRRPEVAVENLEPATPKMPRGQFLAPASQDQVLRLRGGGAAPRPGEKSCDESGRGHGL